MPVTFPTPEELAAMPWHKRDRVLHRLRCYERDLGLLVEPVERTGRSAAGEGVKRDYERAWGERVRAEARALAGES